MGRLRPEEWFARLTANDTRERTRAVARVCQLVSEDGALLARLSDALRSPNDHAVFWVIVKLGSAGPDARATVPALVQCLGERKEFGLREAAVGALVRIAPDDPSVKAAVLGAFTDASPYVRRRALQASIDLVGLSDTDLDLIRGMEADPDEHVAKWSEIALRNIRLKRERRQAERGAAT
jgi:hypothetical protein